ncbi:hypothetical protein SacmaDRAFT_2336 [Saccharomonospora marina XMU15]|uniref:Uncharacterized protein n=1 Tax=Saccharomonospora marina XMU15 TaxID=882083 RepID=H5WWN1_9PSEU|nr:hypothetical protein SacmaDRAFT_2336 [Saccharomonospora marina XMU15]
MTENSLPAADLDAVLARLRRAVERETGSWYARKDAGDNDSLSPLRRIGFLLLELGFTVAEEGGIACGDIEQAVSRAYNLPRRAMEDSDPTTLGQLAHATKERARAMAEANHADSVWRTAIRAACDAGERRKAVANVAGVSVHRVTRSTRSAIEQTNLARSSCCGECP